jgi:hypothetical protein
MRIVYRLHYNVHNLMYETHSIVKKNVRAHCTQCNVFFKQVRLSDIGRERAGTEQLEDLVWTWYKQSSVLS